MRNLMARSLGIIFFAMTAYEGYAQDKGTMINDWQVKVRGNQFLMHWTADASKAEGIFEVQSSSDGAHFQTMAYIFGPDPKSNGLQYACKADVNDEKDIAYFRIKYTDDKGNVETGSVKKFNIQPQG